MKRFSSFRFAPVLWASGKVTVLLLLTVLIAQPHTSHAATSPDRLDGSVTSKETGLKGVMGGASQKHYAELNMDNPFVQFHMAWKYRAGDGVKQSDQTAVVWYRFAVNQGYAPAQHNLGTMYLKGLGVPKDFRKAEKLIRLASEQGYAHAQAKLSVFYIQGVGVPKSYIYAFMWATLAKKNGHATIGRMPELIAERMTSAQLAKAQKLVHQCLVRKYKGC